MTTTYRISQLADRVGVPATTLRFYEKVGLLAADRSPAGYRRYGEADVERVQFIAAAKQLGLALEQIRDLLHVWDDGVCREIRDELRPMIRRQIADADQRIADLTAFRDQLTVALDHLRRLPAKDGRCDSACEFLHLGRPGRAAAPGPTSRSSPSESATDGVESPLACSLDPAGYRERAADWRRLLDGAVRTRLPDGGCECSCPPSAPATSTLWPSPSRNAARSSPSGSPLPVATSSWTCTRPSRRNHS
ncbi:MAG: heavy metal-responsive transcriptional regulator [Pseudonocardia sp.]